MVFILLVTGSVTYAQTITATVADALTKEPIPFATIKILENQGVITNEEGKFNLRIDESFKVVDSIYISSMGYQKKSIALHQPIDSIIYLATAAIELESTFISNKKLDADQIIKKVKENIDVNYDRNLSQKKLFLRQSDFNQVAHVDITNYKSTIDAFNKKLVDSVVNLVPSESAYYQESLCTYTSDFLRHKLHIEKGVKLYDKENQISMDDISEKVRKIIDDHTKPDSYFKLKSGWLPGFKIQMDSIRDDSNAVQKNSPSDSVPKKNYYLRNRKRTLKWLYASLFFMPDSKINIIEKSNRYDFTIDNFTVIGDQVVCVLSFIPKGKEDFKGKIYVDIEDFAIVQLAYKNVKRLKNIHLLGLHFQKYLYEGRSIYRKNNEGKYVLQYLEKREGEKFELDRPLKIKEINKKVKGRNKQNEMSFNLDMSISNITKFEVVILEESSMTEDGFESTVENKSFKPIYQSEYRPEYWEDATIIAPNEAIRSFKAKQSSE